MAVAPPSAMAGKAAHDSPEDDVKLLHQRLDEALTAIQGQASLQTIPAFRRRFDRIFTLRTG